MKELWDRFGTGGEDAPNAPELPEWCFDEEEGSDNEDDDSVHRYREGFDGKRMLDGEERPAKRKRKEHHVKVSIQYLSLYIVFYT